MSDSTSATVIDQHEDLLAVMKKLTHDGQQYLAQMHAIRVAPNITTKNVQYQANDSTNTSKAQMVTT
jgi:hypothetical protein